MDKIVVNSYEEIYSIVSIIRSNFFNSDEIWFRGQGDSSFFLKPSLLRLKNGIKREKELFIEYKRLAAGINMSRDNDWETVIDMQHYGVPTRLLDWTSNLGTALYFALSSSMENGTMALFLLNPIKLNRLSDISEIPILPPYNTQEFSYIKKYIDKKGEIGKYPIAAKSSYFNSRVKAQSGMFTIHGDEEYGAEIDIVSRSLKKDNVIYKIEISQKAIESIRKYFEISGINDYMIFPDIEGIARYLRGWIE